MYSRLMGIYVNTAPTRRVGTMKGLLDFMEDAVVVIRHRVFNSDADPQETFSTTSSTVRFCPLYSRSSFRIMEQNQIAPYLFGLIHCHTEPVLGNATDQFWITNDDHDFLQYRCHRKYTMPTESVKSNTVSVRVTNIQRLVSKIPTMCPVTRMWEY